MTVAALPDVTRNGKGATEVCSRQQIGPAMKHDGWVLGAATELVASQRIDPRLIADGAQASYAC